MGLSIEKSRPTPMNLAIPALEFMKAARAGDVEVKQEQEGASSTTAETPEAEGDIPF